MCIGVDEGIALVIEDEVPIRRFVRMALEGEWWRVVESATAKEGLIDAGTHQPALVILDLGLPDGDRVGLLRGLRGWSSVSVIVLSARSDEQDKIAVPGPLVDGPRLTAGSIGH